MSDAAQWQTQNNRYLSAALVWLRMRLAWQIQREYAVKGKTPPDPIGSINEVKVAQAAAVMAQAADMQPPPALVLLGQRFGLSQFEQQVLLLCVAMELDRHVAGLCAQLYPYQPHPTFALVLSLFDEPTWDALSPDRPLRYWQLLEIHQPSAHPLVKSALQADERIVNYLKGLNNLDDRLDAFLVPFEAAIAQTELPTSQQALVETISHRLQQSAHSLPVIQLLGADSLSKQGVAWHTAAAFGLHLYRLPVELLPTQASELETLTRLWQRESLLLPIALYLDAQEIDPLPVSEGQASPLHRLLLRSQGLIFLATREPRSQLGRFGAAIDVTKPTPAEQKSAWEMALGSQATNSPTQLVAQFDLNLPEIQHIAQTALNMPAPDASGMHQQVWQACLISTRPRLDALAQRLDPKATWDDLVLPEKELNLLHQLVNQVQQRTQVYEAWGFNQKMNRGLGINALFAGDSGTGKTMAAEVIANALQLNLYRIDLSAVVSKYIGETEKNLRRLFDAAEEGGAILFFDEADALFGRRSEVKDSHDRYANIEINYLLQRMEAYRGVAILATNLKSSLDKAFLRRLRFLIDFPFPGLAERKSIWQRAFPPETPTEGLEYERLARFNLTGGSLHNIALNASFLAAEAGSAVTMPLVLSAIRTELDKLERPINETDFYWQVEEAMSVQPVVVRN